jgi:uncharacterized RDD family membrane protein YckC
MADGTGQGKPCTNLHPCVEARLNAPGAEAALERSGVEDPESGGGWVVLYLKAPWRLRPFERCLAEQRRCPVHSRLSWTLPRTCPRAVWIARPECLPEAALRLPAAPALPSKIVGVAPTPAVQRWCRTRGCLPLGGLFSRAEEAAPLVYSGLSDPGLEHSRAAAGLRAYCLALVAAYMDKIVTLGLGLSLVILYTRQWPRTWQEVVSLLASGVLILVVSAFLYYWGGVTLFGCTLGQRLVGLRVVNEHGELPGGRRAFVRELAGTIPRYIPGVGHLVRIADYSWLLFSGGTQLLRDCAAGTHISVRPARLSDAAARLVASLLDRIPRRRMSRRRVYD